MAYGTSTGLVPSVSAPRSAKLTWPRPVASAQGSGRTSLAQSGVSRERAVLIQATGEVRTAIEDAVVAAQHARSLTVVLEEALAVLTAAESGRIESLTRPAMFTTRAGSLSPREREVLALVAEGRTNKDIAEALFVSPNTIKTHVASLLNKLHADSRAQLAAIATRRVVNGESNADA